MRILISLLAGALFGGGLFGSRANRLPGLLMVLLFTGHLNLNGVNFSESPATYQFGGETAVGC